MSCSKWIVVAVIALCGGTAAHADTLKEQARKAVAAGLEAQNAGRYDEAIAYYRTAYDAVPHHEILFNLAQAHRLKGDVSAALGLYQRYLVVEPRGRVAADARRWVAELQKLAAQRRAENAGADAARDSAAGAATGAPARGSSLPGGSPAGSSPLGSPGAGSPGAGSPGAGSPGPGAPGAGAPGTGAQAAGASQAPSSLATPSSTTGSSAPSGPAASAAIRTSVGAGSTSVGAGSASVDARSSGATPAGAPVDRAPLSRLRRYAIFTASGGGGAVLVGATFGLLARGKRNEAVAICGDDRACDSDADALRANALLSASRSRGSVATVMLGLGSAAVVTGAILWFTDRERAPRTAIAPAVSRSSVGLTWGGQF
jgi:Tetratricopeptide repeat